MIQSQKPWLILGADGRLGRALQSQLAPLGIEYLAISRSHLDLSLPVDFTTLAARLNWPEFAVIVNCAGYTDVDRAEAEPQLANRLNAEVVSELASFCQQTNTRFIQLSTNYVFDGRQQRPYLVSDSPNPLQEYGRSKLLGEDAVRAAVAQGARAAIVRTGWLYGTHPTRAALPERLAQRLIAGQPIFLTEQLGSPTWAADLSEYLVQLTQLPDAEFVGIHHAVAAGQVSWYDFGLQIGSDLDVSPELVVHSELTESGGARRPLNGLLEPTSVAGYSIPNWLNGWQRYLPEFQKELGR